MCVRTSKYQVGRIIQKSQDIRDHFALLFFFRLDDFLDIIEEVSSKPSSYSTPILSFTKSSTVLDLFSNPIFWKLRSSSLLYPPRHFGLTKEGDHFYLPAYDKLLIFGKSESDVYSLISVYAEKPNTATCPKPIFMSFPSGSLEMLSLEEINHFLHLL